MNDLATWLLAGAAGVGRGSSGEEHPDRSCRVPNPRGPNAVLQAIARDRLPVHRVGGLEAGLVTPRHVRGPAGAKDIVSSPRIAALQGRDELEEEKTRVILARMANSTQRTWWVSG